MVHADGHSAEADTPPEATKEQFFEMRIEIRFPPRARLEELMLGDLDVIAMSNGQVQTPADAALFAKHPAEVFEHAIQRAEQLRIVNFVR